MWCECLRAHVRVVAGWLKGVTKHYLAPVHVLGVHVVLVLIVLPPSVAGGPLRIRHVAAILVQRVGRRSGPHPLGQL